MTPELPRMYDFNCLVVDLATRKMVDVTITLAKTTIKIA